MKQVIRNINTALYFVKGKGFSEADINNATRFNDFDEANDYLESNEEAIEDMGIDAEIVEGPAEEEKVAEAPVNQNIKQNEDGSSWGVGFIRSDDLSIDFDDDDKKVLGIDITDEKPNARRFATVEEANTHAERILVERNHEGFYLFKDEAPVNSYINAETGKTNPKRIRA